MALTSKIPLSEVVDLYTKQEWTMQQIADRFGMTRQAIQNRLARAGVAGRPALGGKPWEPAFERSVLEKLCVEKRLSVREIAERLNSNRSTVERSLKLYGIRQRARRGRGFKYPQLQKLAIGQSLDFPKDKQAAPYASFYAMARYIGIRVSVFTIDENTIRVTRKA